LRTKNPEYLNIKVEDRLLEKGQQYKFNLVENSEKAYLITESIPKTRSHSKSILSANNTVKQIKTNNTVKQNKADKSEILVNEPSSHTRKNNQSNKRVNSKLLLSPTNSGLNKSIYSQKSLHNESLNNSSTSSIKKIPSIIRNDSKENLDDHLIDIRKHLSNYYTAKGQPQNKAVPKSANSNKTALTKQSKKDQNKKTEVIKNVPEKPKTYHSNKISLNSNLHSPKESDDIYSYNSAKMKNNFNNELKNYYIIARKENVEYENPFQETTTQKKRYNFINPCINNNTIQSESSNTNNNTKKPQDIINSYVKTTLVDQEAISNPVCNNNVTYKPLVESYNPLKNKFNKHQEIPFHNTTGSTNSNKRMKDLTSIITFASNLNTITEEYPIRNTKQSLKMGYNKPENVLIKQKVQATEIREKELSQEEQLNNYLDKMNDNTYKQHTTKHGYYRESCEPMEITKDRPIYEFYIDKNNIERTFTLQNEKENHAIPSFKNEVKEYPRQYNYSTSQKTTGDGKISYNVGNNLQSKPSSNKHNINDLHQYHDEFDRIKSEIDNLNEKLKLSDITKDYEKEKISERVTAMNIRVYSKPISNIQ
jgi:hypothetical protein